MLVANLSACAVLLACILFVQKAVVGAARLRAAQRRRSSLAAAEEEASSSALPARYRCIDKRLHEMQVRSWLE